MGFVRGELSSGEISWEKFVSAGSNHLILQNIYLEYKKHDLLGMLPEDLQEHLREIHRLTSERNLEIVKQSRELSVCFSEAGIEHVFTKGVGHLLDKVYEDVGGRIMGDIDVVVRDEEWLKGVEVMKEFGYYNVHPYNPKIKHTRKHYPRLIKKAAPVEVELHYIPVKYRYSKLFSTKLVFENKKLVGQGLLGYVMNDRSKIIHNFMHSQMDHEGRKTANIHLRNLYDMLLLSRRENLVEVLGEFKHYKKHSDAYLALIQRVFNLDIFGDSPSDQEIGINSFSSRGFLRKHSLHTNYPVFLRLKIFFMLVPNKFFTQFFKRPFQAIYDKEIRDHLVKAVGSREAWGRLVSSYLGFFRK